MIDVLGQWHLILTERHYPVIRYIKASALAAEPRLRDTMFRDRADQFKTRLGWEVTVDQDGFERDEYDDGDPLYVIWVQPDGSHGGSMRLIPTDRPTMVNDHFAHLLESGPVVSPEIWECTRFCLSRGATGGVAAALMLAGGEVMRAFGLTHLLGVFDARMVRVYRAIGANPQVLGTSGEGRDQISVGLWQFCDADRSRVLRRAGVSSQLSEHWFERSFGRPITMPKVA